MLNEVAGIPSVTFGLHLCRGTTTREQLALSTQCGFASAGPGNAISEDAQENKLRLVGEVANRVWGTGE
jgi:hypothetical protein